MQSRPNWLYLSILGLLVFTFAFLFWHNALAVHNTAKSAGFTCTKTIGDPAGASQLTITAACQIINQLPGSYCNGNYVSQSGPGQAWTFPRYCVEDAAQNITSAIANSCLGGEVDYRRLQDQVDVWVNGVREHSVCHLFSCHTQTDDAQVHTAYILPHTTPVYSWQNNPNAVYRGFDDSNRINLYSDGGDNYNANKQAGIGYVPARRILNDCAPLENSFNLTVSADHVSENGNYTVSWTASTPPSGPVNSCSLTINSSLAGGVTNSTETTHNSETLTDLQTGIYTNTLTCRGILDAATSVQGGTLTKSKIVTVGNVPPPPVVNLKVDPQEIKKGDSATLSWDVQNAAAVTISGIGTVAAHDSIKVTPNFTTRYSLQAKSEFSALPVANTAVILRVIAPTVQLAPTQLEVAPEKVIPQAAPPSAPSGVQLLVNGQHDPITLSAPASFQLSWSLDRYCLAYGSWLGIKRTSGNQDFNITQAGNYTYTIYCPGFPSASDSVTVKVVGAVGGTGAGGVAVPLPVAEAGISTDGINYFSNVKVIRGKPTEIWISAGKDVTGDNKASRDENGDWGSLMSEGKCLINTNLNQGKIPDFPGTVFNPQSANDCNVDLGKLTFNDAPGTYRYGVLRLLQNDGKLSNIAYVTITVANPPPPSGPPVIDLRINGQTGPLTLGVPVGYALSWNVVNADTCSASGSWAGDQPVSGTQNFVASSKRDFSYTLTCVGQKGTATSTVNLKAVEAPICNFTADPTLIPKSAFIRQSTLTWSCQQAIKCFMTPDVGAGTEVFGSVRVSPQTNTTYKLTCNNLDISKDFNVNVSLQ